MPKICLAGKSRVVLISLGMLQNLFIHKGITAAYNYKVEEKSKEIA